MSCHTSAREHSPGKFLPVLFNSRTQDRAAPPISSCIVDLPAINGCCPIQDSVQLNRTGTVKAPTVPDHEGNPMSQKHRRSNKETKKPKQNKPKAGPALSPFA